MLLKKWNFKKLRKRFRNESGFTLIETVVSIGVIALISNVFLASVISTSANSDLANVVSHMDNLTSQAKEVFQSHPNEVLDGSAKGNTKYAPYSENGMQFLIKASNPRTVSYTKYYSDDLGLNMSYGATDPEVVYKTEMVFTPKDIKQVKGFSFQTQKYTMEANVYRKQGGTFNKDAIYTRTFEFDQIQTKQFPTLDRNIQIEFDANGGKVVIDGVSSADTIHKQMYFKGESLYSQKTITAAKSDETFIGWSEKRNDTIPVLIDPNNYTVESNKKLYAQYLSAGEFRVDFKIRDDEFWANYNLDRAETTVTFQKDFNDPNIQPKIEEIDRRTENMFRENVVGKRGYKFDGWVDSRNQDVSVETRLKNPYLAVYPKWKKLDNGRTEVLSLNLKLDLNNVEVDKKSDDGTTRLYALYPFTKMEYSMSYDASTDSFSVKQVEKINNPDGSFTQIFGSKYKHGSILSEKTFNMSDPNARLYLERKDKKYTKVTDYIKDTLIDKDKPSFTIDDITLNVDVPTFELDKDGYYHSKTATNDPVKYTELKNANGTEILKDTADQFFRETPGSREPVFRFKDNKPVIDEQSVDQLNKLVQKICDQPTLYPDNFMNVGYITYWSNSDKGYRTSRPEDGGGANMNVPSSKYATNVKKIGYNLQYYIPLALTGNVEATISTYDITITQYVDYIKNKLMAEVSVLTTAPNYGNKLGGWTNRSIFANGPDDHERQYASIEIADYYDAEKKSFAYLENFELGIDFDDVFRVAKLEPWGIKGPKSTINIKVESRPTNITDFLITVMESNEKNALYHSFIEDAMAPDTEGNASLKPGNKDHVRSTLKEIFNGTSILPSGGNMLTFSEKTKDLEVINAKDPWRIVDSLTGYQIGQGALKNAFEDGTDFHEYNKKCIAISGTGVNEEGKLSSRCFGPKKGRSPQETTMYDDIIKVNKVTESDITYSYQVPGTKKVPLNTFADVAGPGRNYLPPFIKCQDKK